MCVPSFVRIGAASTHFERLFHLKIQQILKHTTMNSKSPDRHAHMYSIKLEHYQCLMYQDSG